MEGMKGKESVYKWAALNGFIALSIVVFKYAMPQVGAESVTFWVFAAFIQYILMGLLLGIPLFIWCIVEILIASFLRHVPFVGGWLVFLPSALVSLLLLFIMIGPELSFSSTGGKTCRELYVPGPNPTESQVQRFLECINRNR